MNRMRSAVTICALLAFMQAELGAEVLQPGLLPTQQPQQQAQPGQLPPPTSTTVVEVTVPSAKAESNLDLVVVEGEGEANITDKKSSTRPLVRVVDGKKEPVEGAVVTFIAPADGPSVLFSNGMRTITVLTNAQGWARVPSMRAVNAGEFKLQVSASFHGEMVNTTISQKNYDSKAEAAKGGTPSSTSDPGSEKDKRPAANKKSGLSGGVIAVIVGGGAAAVLGIALGLGGKSSSSSTTTTTSATIGGTGTVTVGAPH